MSKIKDIVGNVYGELVVISFAYINDKYRSFWNCECSCGKIKVISKHSLTTGRTKTCGHNIKNNSTTHNMSYSRFYNIYKCMKNRCYNENNTYYDNYGGRGILICNEWRSSFLTFKKDMYEAYIKHLEEYGENNTTIDRIDNEGNYNKDNCKWSTRKEQANNTGYNSGRFGSKERDDNFKKKEIIGED